MRILLVCKEGRITQRTGSILRSSGHTVFHAPNVHEALRVAEEVRPERVVASVDIDHEQSPHMVRSMRKRSLARDFLFVTGDDSFRTPADLNDIPVLHEPLFAAELLVPLT